MLSLNLEKINVIMKKIYLSALMLTIAGGISAQQSGVLTTKHEMAPAVNSGTIDRPVTEYQERATILWSDDFSTSANWTMNNTSAPISWDWVITTNMADMPNAAASLYPFASTTATNGFALINSDGQPGNADGDGAIVANMRMAASLDCSANPNVVVRFQHNYRWWHDSRGIRVSGDNGATWTEYWITSDNGGVFANGYPNLQNSENPVYEQINISAVAGGQSNVLVEFWYNDNDYWGWYWVVDDFEIIEQPADDVQLLSAWVSGINNDGIEYGRTPTNHLDPQYNVGGEVYNFGVNTQTNIILDADFTSFTSQSTFASILPDSTEYIETAETLTLPVGIYSGDYMVQTDNELIGSPEFGDNTYERAFEVTTNIYSVDGIGNHPTGYEVTARIGTGSFTGSEDYFVIGNQYRIKTNDQVSGLRVMLDPTTVPGGQITASIKDTTTWFQNDMTSLIESAPVEITSAHVTQGYVDVFFSTAEPINAGAYYACVMMESYGNSFDIFLVDDQTVAQPYYASMIYIEGDQVYSNGEAVGIRMLMGASWGAGVEENTLTGISVYPNPSNGVITITNDENINSTVAVYDMVGNVVYTNGMSAQTTVDLSSFGAGMYIVKVSNEEGTFVEQIVIK